MGIEIVKSNVWEIKKAFSLKILGGLMALSHLLLFGVWTVQGQLPVKLALQGQPMCWSLMENCAWMHLPPSVLSVIYFAYAIFMGLAALVLILTDWVAFGFYLLMFGGLFGSILYFQDLRLSTNEGYFIFFLTFAYLFVPSKHRLMRGLVVSFFVAKGLSQCAADWLTGGWYLEHLHLPVKLAEWLAAMTVLVQMIGAAALLFRDARYFWSGWLALFAYECAYLYIGESFGALLGLGALLYVALDELELRKAEREYIYQSFIRPEPSFFWGGALLLLFWAAQVSPFLKLPRGSSLKSGLNIFALHTDAAQEECHQKTVALFKGRSEEMDVEPQGVRQATMFCNPYLRYLDLKALCQKFRAESPEFVTISSVFQVRNFRERASYRAFEVQDFCADDLTFKRLPEVQWTMNPGK